MNVISKKQGVVDAEVRGRVLVLGINYTPEPIGIGKYTGEFAGSLVREGFEVSVVTAHPHYPWWRVRGARGFSVERSERLTVIRCPVWVPSRAGAVGRMLQDLSFFVSSWLAVTGLLMRGRRFDLVYTVIPSYPTAWLGVWVKLFRRKTLWVIHVMDLPLDAAVRFGLIRNGWLSRWLARSERWVMRRADRVSSLSEGMLRMIGEKGVEESRRICFPNWVDLTVFHPGPPKAGEAELSGLGLPKEGRMVLYSGAIGEKQCLDILPEVAARMMRYRSDIYFVIAGEGPYRQRLETLAGSAGADNMLFISIQPETVFKALLKKAWLHLVLQRDTGSELFLPSKLGPIMAVGGCAIVTASPGSSLDLLLRVNEIGKPLHPTTVDTLYSTIVELDRNPGSVRTLGDRASKYVELYLERHAVIRRYLSDLGFGKGLGSGFDIHSPPGAG